MADNGKHRNGVIKIQRAGGFWKDRIRNYRIFLDGSPAGKISEYAILRLGVPAGTHTVRFKCDFLASQPLEVPVQAGKEVGVVCAAGQLPGRSRARGYVKSWLGELDDVAPPETAPPIP